MDDSRKLSQAVRAIQTATAEHGRLSHFDMAVIYFNHGCYESACKSCYDGHCKDDSRCSTMLGAILLDGLVKDGDYLFSLKMGLRVDVMSGGKYYPECLSHRTFSVEAALLLEAANQGNEKAMLLIAFYRAQNKCLDISVEEALKWLDKAAKKGMPEAVALKRQMRGGVFRAFLRSLKNAIFKTALEVAEDDACDLVDETIAGRQR